MEREAKPTTSFMSEYLRKRISLDKRADGQEIRDRITLFAAALEAASNGKEQTQTSPENSPQTIGSRSIELCKC